MAYGKRVLTAVTIALLLASAALAGQTIEGNVVSSVTGAGVPETAVTSIRAGEVAYSASTDAAGRFRFASVEPGIYTANYVSRGFWPIPNFLVDEDFDRACGQCFLSQRGHRPILVAAGSDPVRLEVKMTPLTKISGRVLDDKHEPVPNAQVYFHWGENWLCQPPSCHGVSRQTKTNEKGEYSTTSLDLPGAWLLSAVAPSSWRSPEPHDDSPLGWAETFYPGVTDTQLSVRLTVRPADVIANVDIKLAALPVHRIRGVLLDPDGHPAPLAQVTLCSRTGSSIVRRTTGKDGSFAFETVAEGEWQIAAMGGSGSRFWTAQWVHMASHDLDGLELRLAAPFAVQGRIVMEAPDGTAAPALPTVGLLIGGGLAPPDERGGSAFRAGRPDAAGHFQIPNVYAGLYEILPGPAPSRYYLDSIRIGSYDALGADVAIVPESALVTIVYKPGGGTVRGTVENCAGGTVRLLARNKALWRDGFVYFAPCDANDRYEIHDVRPGDYYATAASGDTAIPLTRLWDADGASNRAANVTVRPNENSSADLRVNQQ